MQPSGSYLKIERAIKIVRKKPQNRENAKKAIKKLKKGRAIKIGGKRKPQNREKNHKIIGGIKKSVGGSLKIVGKFKGKT